MTFGSPHGMRVDSRVPSFGHATLFAAVVAFTVFLALRDVPFLSEDWTHLAEAREQSSFLASLDPRLEPLRPFQHAFFWVLAHCGVPWTDPALPMCARVTAFVLHLASCALVYALARELGLSKTASAIAMALFVAFPSVKSLVWPAAIGSPGRVACELASLACFVRWTRTSSRIAGTLAFVFFVLGLGFHESAMLLPAFFVLWIGLAGEPGEPGGTGMRDVIARLLRKLRERTFFSACALGIAYVLYQAFLRPQRHHDWKSLDALPANGVKAALSLVPGSVRAFAIEGLRGHEGAIGWLVGGAAVAAVLIVLARALARTSLSHSELSRFLALAIAIELTLPVLGTGFAQRYATLAAAFLAIGLAAWFERAPSLLRGTAIALLIVSMLVDTATDAIDASAAGRSALQVIASARTERASAPADSVIAVVDLPDMMGRENDLPVFNWGADIAFAEYGLGRQWLFWRTREFKTTTSVERVDADRIAEALRTGGPRVLVYSPGVGLVPAVAGPWSK
jgi:hypothetical protein